MKLSTKTKKIGVISGVILVVVIILGETYNIPVVSTGVNYVLYPFQKSVSFISTKTSDVLGYFKNVQELTKENETLKAENEKLFYKNTILAQYQEENENLKKILDMKQLYKDYAGIGANVIGKDTGNWYKVFTIDKGTKHGVGENSVILANGGLVGHVWESTGIGSESATDITSKVLSIIDDRSAVSAKVVRTGDIGILRGDIELANKGLCVLEINIESEVVKGDQIITSHLESSIYPPGIPIGIVEEVVPGKNNLTRYAYVKPIADFKHLEQVLVINND